MENNELNITWCYPDILNLHGDRGNIMALKRVAELLELKVNINKIENYQDEIDFENTDILFFNAGELKVVEPIVEALKSKKEELDNYIKKGKIIMAIGSTGAVFAQEVMRTDGSIVKGLGYLDMRCIEREYVYGDDLIYRLKAKFDRNTKCLNKSEYEFRNMLTVSQLIIKSALKSCESRGAHCRLDYPETIETGIHNCIIKGQGEPSFVK